ncbi:MBL fold metallo-hydrolase [Limosilactobacillus mucosae]|uniref:MBL fold metallo-hydrolase n=1 Tax=Limosilactobacillus mucosae TaxID=97478 RepID=UPI0025A32CDB|nr:MBL fold metallo-hydrolase [Limosilactobacillus mucosae]MDM8220360.1 MBL fold metallo-hydrolase [Limosilactobacillus mucosae]MDM8315206.1 MBL fold metallo-hydrolase [Limosilactobacillus mucosae]
MKTKPNQIKIHVLHTGQVIVDEALPFHHKGDLPWAFTGMFRLKSHRITVPVSVYLIEHPHGLVLIDTGWNKANRDHQLKNLSFQWPVNKAVLPYGQSVDERLNKMGIQPSDLDYVLFSHLHYLPHEWKNVPLKTFELADSNDGAWNRSFDLFGDGTIKMIWEPGHSAGLCAAKLQAPGRKEYVMLASDGGYAAKSWIENLTPGIVIDRKAAQRSLNYLAEVAKDQYCIECIANHDPAVQPHEIVLPY